MAYMTIRQIRHQLCLNKLRDMGCEVVNLQGVMFYVKYLLEDFKISYIYHINPDDTYFLERIKPYTVPAGDFKTEEEIVESIKVDIEQFKNAKHSKNFNDFIEVDKEISNAVRAFEDLFLYYNISKEDTVLLKDEITKVKTMLKDIKSRSKRVFYEKDSQILEDL